MRWQERGADAGLVRCAELGAGRVSLLSTGAGEGPATWATDPQAHGAPRERGGSGGQAAPLEAALMRGLIG